MSFLDCANIMFFFLANFAPFQAVYLFAMGLYLFFLFVVLWSCFVVFCCDLIRFCLCGSGVLQYY